MSAVIPALSELERLGTLGELGTSRKAYSELVEQLMRMRRFLSAYLVSLSKAA
jgi:hypothetical protein